MAERRLRPVVRRGLIAGGALVTAAGLAYGSTYTWLFAAESVHVEGASRIAAPDVRRIGGVDVGTNVFHLDVTGVENRLLEDPRVASAHVVTDLPDVVTIRIVERVPVARAEVGNTTVTVADDGAILPGVPAASLPEIRVVAGTLDDVRRTEAASALAALAPSVRRSVVTAFSGVDRELVLETDSGLTVTYGPVVDVEEKAASIRAVLGWADDEALHLTAIDVSVPNAPTARTATGSVTPT
jgi:cell division protein FtsQ